MTLEALHSASDVSTLADRRLDAAEDHHEKLFRVYLEIETAMGAVDRDEDAAVEGMIEAQTAAINTAAALPARSMRDLLFKLALWRWDSPDLEMPIGEMNRADAIAYSAFRDLAAILGESDVLKEFDKRN